MRQRDLMEGARHGRNGGLPGKAGKLVDDADEVAEEAEGMLRRYRDAAISGAKSVDTKVRGFASDHPVATLLMAVGLGYGLGYLIYRRVKA